MLYSFSWHKNQLCNNGNFMALWITFFCIMVYCELFFKVIKKKLYLFIIRLLIMYYFNISIQFVKFTRSFWVKKCFYSVMHGSLFPPMNNFFYIYKLAIVTFILRLPDINSNCDFFLRIVSYKLAIASYKVQFWGENILGIFSELWVYLQLNLRIMR